MSRSTVVEPDKHTHTHTLGFEIVLFIKDAHTNLLRVYFYLAAFILKNHSFWEDGFR